MAEITLAASTGRVTGTRSSRRLRAEGVVPGTVYGLGGTPETVSVVWRELRRALTGEDGRNALISLTVEGSKVPVMVKELQRHPVRRDVIHVDFLRVNPDVAMFADVPLVMTGEAADLARQGGVADQVLSVLHVEAKPDDLPSEIAVDVTGLQAGESIRVGDLQLPDGVTTGVDPEDPVVVAHAGSTMEAPAEGEAEAGGDTETEG
jgi:large subunit ribosomal protein L25